MSQEEQLSKQYWYTPRHYLALYTKHLRKLTEQLGKNGFPLDLIQGTSEHALK
jgi:hypothetical protein